MTTVEPASTHESPRQHGEQRIDVLSGDRCCAKCGFNLHGQMIVREPHYGLLIVRCPECGQPAAMQEYPTLTRWVGRVRFALVAIWVAWLIAGVAATGGIMYGFSQLAAQAVVAPYARLAAGDWNSWNKANAPANQNQWYPNPGEMEKWWTALPPDKYFADFGSWAALNWRGLYAWLFLLAFMLPAGVLWSAFFARLRGGRLLLPLLLPIAFAALLLLDDLLTSTLGWFYSPDRLVARQVGWLPALMSIAFGSACLFAGALLGRRILRAVLGAVLPVRLLPAVSFLWLADDRPLPRPRASGG